MKNSGGIHGGRLCGRSGVDGGGGRFSRMERIFVVSLFTSMKGPLGTFKDMMVTGDVFKVTVNLRKGLVKIPITTRTDP
jgi:hypothetical protein